MRRQLLEQLALFIPRQWIRRHGDRGNDARRNLPSDFLISDCLRYTNTELRLALQFVLTFLSFGLSAGIPVSEKQRSHAIRARLSAKVPD
jgi:hypothetical protein